MKTPESLPREEDRKTMQLYPDIQAPQKPALLRRIFLGSQGWRAGWSALLFLLIFVPLGLAAGELRRIIVHVDRDRPATPGASILRESLLLAALFLATWIMSRIEKRSVLSYGFVDRHKLRRLTSGILVGVVAVSALIGMLWASRVLVFDARLLSGAALWKYAVLWGVMFLLVAIFEEGLLRGYLQYTLARGMNFWWAACILSILFGALHSNNNVESPIGIFVAIAAGLVFCLSLRLTGSLWWVVGVHTGWGWSESYLYGAANSGVLIEGHLYATHPIGKIIWSGGSAGPEGSIFALPVLLLMAIGIWLMWREATA